MAGVTLYQRHWQMLTAISQANGGIGRSAAIRLVLERFVRQEKALDIVRSYQAGVITAKEAMGHLVVLVRAQTKKQSEAGAAGQ
jgi:hypothetical protein